MKKYKNNNERNGFIDENLKNNKNTISTFNGNNNNEDINENQNPTEFKNAITVKKYNKKNDDAE